MTTMITRNFNKTHNMLQCTTIYNVFRCFCPKLILAKKNKILSNFDSICEKCMQIDLYWILAHQTGGSKTRCPIGLDQSS